MLIIVLFCAVIFMPAKLIGFRFLTLAIPSLFPKLEFHFECVFKCDFIISQNYYLQN